MDRKMLNKSGLLLKISRSNIAYKNGATVNAIHEKAINPISPTAFLFQHRLYNLITIGKFAY